MTKRPFRIVYNQDCTNLFATTREPIGPQDVDHMVDEVADGGAQVMLINPNAQLVNYPSRVWQTFWDGYEPGKRTFFGSIPEDGIAGREAWLGQMQRLAGDGCDYLARALARCRAKGITPGVSVRMNDMHDAPWPDSHFFSRFYVEHPEWHLDNPAICGWGAKGWDYTHEGVREHYLALIRELVECYDLDVLELDFMRFQCYFPRTDIMRHADIMTGFIRAVREILNSSGRSIELIPRIATNPAAALELGFDVAAWAKDGLVDGITAAAFLNTNWDIPVDAFRRLAGRAIAVYAGTDFLVEHVPELPKRSLPLEADLMRGLASGYAAAGADGLNFFNFFCTRESPSERHDPLFHLLRELRDPAALRGRSKTYTVTAASGGGMNETDRPSVFPAILSSRHRKEILMLMASESRKTKVVAILSVCGSSLPDPAHLWLHVNDGTACSAAAMNVETFKDKQVGILTFNFPPAVLRNGWNRVVIRNEGNDVTLLRLDVQVDPPTR